LDWAKHLAEGRGFRRRVTNCFASWTSQPMRLFGRVFSDPIVSLSADSFSHRNITIMKNRKKTDKRYQSASDKTSAEGRNV
jgi:hypothetical protein